MPIYYKVIHGETIDKRKLKPFWIENISNSTFSWRWSGINTAPAISYSYSKDLINWTNESVEERGLGNYNSLNPGERVYIKCSDTLHGTYGFRTLAISVSNPVAAVGGNIMSLIYGNSFTGEETDLVYDNTFEKLFYQNKGIKDASNLILPATTLRNSCYTGLFYYCTSLTSAPELPATTLADNCYKELFINCTSLIKAPELPAATLKSSCYNNMFVRTALQEITCLATSGINTASSTTSWVTGVPSTGIFYKKTGVTWPTGANGIPEGWTVVEV